MVTSPRTDATFVRKRASSECHRLIINQTLCHASVGESVRCLQEVLIMRKRRVQSKRLNKTVAANRRKRKLTCTDFLFHTRKLALTVAANRRKRKLTCMKKKVSARNRVFVHLVNH